MELFLKANSAFSIDCSSSPSNFECSQDRIYVFKTLTDITDVVSFNMVPGIDVQNNRDNEDNASE